MANRFDVKVGRGYGQMLTGFGDRLARSGEIERGREADTAKQKYIADMKREGIEAYQSGDIDRILETSLKYPEIGQSLLIANQHKNKATEKNHIDTMWDMLADPTDQNVKDLIAARQGLLSGEQADSKETDAALERFRADPEGFIKGIEQELSYIDTAKMIKVRELTKKTEGKDIRTTNVKDWEYYNELKKTDPAAAELFGVKVGIIKGEGEKKAAELKDVLEFRKHVNTNPVIKDYLAVDTQVKRLDQTVKDIEEQRKSGKQVSYIAVDQALITILNKMLDPTSVVRESEYARTPGDQAALARIKGKWDQLTTGGAALTDNDRDSVLRMARRFSSVAKEKMGPEVDSFKRLAKKFGVDFNDVISPTLLEIEEENRSTFSGVTEQAPRAALELLKSNPDMAEAFKGKYGYLPEGY